MGSLPLSKICTKCGVEKSLDEFALERSKRDGRASHCLLCRRGGRVLPVYVDKPGEQWKDVVDYEGIYQVSNYGTVKRVKRAAATRVGAQVKHLAPSKSYFYPRVVLHNQDRGKSFFVHALVAAAFLGPRPEGHQINHKNGDKLNPGADNLEYCTQSENWKHALNTGLLNPAKGEKFPQAKLTDEKVREIKALKGKMQQSVIAKHFGVGESVVSRILSGKSWSHVT